MGKLAHSFEFVLKPLPPYSFKLTVRKPAGWSLFTPFEIYEGGALWTAAHLNTSLFGMRLESVGNVDECSIRARIFTDVELEQPRQMELRRLVGISLGVDQDLAPFYEMAIKDSILSHTIPDLYGLHDTFPIALFPEAVLAILLQMAPLKRSNEMIASFIRNYGEVAEFDGKQVYAWPTQERLAGVSEKEISSKCKVGYRSKHIVKLAGRLAKGDFPTAQQLMDMGPEEAKKLLISLPGIGDYSADIINPHGGFPIDAWSAEVFGKLFFGREPENNREAIEKVKSEGLKRWGKWAWMAFFYIAQDLPNLSEKLGISLRLT